MTNRLINKIFDIYSYPDELESNLTTLTLGDLHGNPIKLIHFLFRHQIIKFKPPCTEPQKKYHEFVTLYEQYGELLQEYLESRTLLQLTQIKINNTEERILTIKKQLILESNTESPVHQSIHQLSLQFSTKLEAALAEQVELRDRLSKAKGTLSYYVTQFNHFMSALEISDRKTTIRLLGDEVADRGNCDYFTLRILHFLHINHVSVSILLSNHGSEFIYGYEQLLQGHPFVPQGQIVDFQITSFWGLQILLEQNIVTAEELIHLINQSYKPTLKLIDYATSENTITLFSHAPVPFSIIQMTANSLKVTYDDSTIETLAMTIEHINREFHSYIKNNSLHLLLHNSIHDKTNMSDEERVKWPLINLIWNRWSERKETENTRPGSQKSYRISYVHGHDAFESTLPYIYNLDTLSGKCSRKTENELIRQAFNRVKESRTIDIKNKEAAEAEFYLYNVLREKVLDSDESTLSKKKEISCEKELISSIKKLSFLGKPSPHKPTLTLIELSTENEKIYSPEEVMPSTEPKDEKLAHTLNSVVESERSP